MRFERKFIMPRERELTCGMCGKRYIQSAMRKCKHPAVVRRFGENICIYSCRRCKFNKFLGVLNEICTYEEDEHGQAKQV